MQRIFLFPAGLILFISFISIASPALAESGPVEITSPGGELRISFAVDGAARTGFRAGELTYAITYRGKALIENSALQLDLAGAPPLGSDVQIVSHSNSRTDETYRLVTGKASTIRNKYNALRLNLTELRGLHRQLTALLANFLAVCWPNV